MQADLKTARRAQNDERHRARVAATEGPNRSRLVRRMKRDDLTAHGFRPTFRDWAAERTRWHWRIRVSSEVEQAYRRGDRAAPSQPRRHL
jgi:hypothetical protein